MKQHKWNTDCVLCEKGISHNHLSLEEMQSTTTKSLKYKEWQGLSDDEIHKLYSKEYDKYHISDTGSGCISDNEWEIWIAKAIEQKLKEKNHGTT